MSPSAPRIRSVTYLHSEHGGGLKPELSELSIYEPVRAEDQVCDLPCIFMKDAHIWWASSFHSTLLFKCIR